ncbi:MAG: hypothetical protein V4726_16750 [Verrucomicrobiota bacterium]
MPNFLYQILPAADAAEEPIYYQISQEADEAALTSHPHTGEAWERVFNDDGTPVILPESGGCGCGEKDCC